jgi:uncharacterized protein (TIGR02118 family)
MAGQASIGAVLKVIFPCRRLPGLERAEYARRILEGHVPLALRHHPTMRRYTVNVVERGPADGPELDSVAELSFDSLEDYRDRLYDSEEGRRAIGLDVARFLGSAHAYLSREHLHRDAPVAAPLGTRTPGVKWLLFVRRRPELDRAAFLAHWHGVHVPLVLDALPALRRYATHPIERQLGAGGPDWDGVAALWFESCEAAGADLHRAGAAIDADTAKFIADVRSYSVAEWPQKR